MWLQELLAAGGKPVREIMAAATEAGIAERTLRRARERLCQRPRRLGDRWVWELTSGQNQQGGQDGHHRPDGQDGARR